MLVVTVTDCLWIFPHGHQHGWLLRKCSVMHWGHAPSEVHHSRDILAVYDDEASVRRLSPDQAKLLVLDEGLGVIVTARGDEADFVSRFFVPKAGIAEDPVTGSAHCTLVPFWAERLGRSKLVAHQVSPRGGELHCEHRGDRVIMAGQCTLFLTGSIHLARERGTSSSITDRG